MTTAAVQDGLVLRSLARIGHMTLFLLQMLKQCIRVLARPALIVNQSHVAKPNSIANQNSRVRTTVQSFANQAKPQPAPALDLTEQTVNLQNFAERQCLDIRIRLLLGARAAQPLRLPRKVKLEGHPPPRDWTTRCGPAFAYLREQLAFASPDLLTPGAP